MFRVFDQIEQQWQMHRCFNAVGMSASVSCACRAHSKLGIWKAEKVGREHIFGQVWWILLLSSEGWTQIGTAQLADSGIDLWKCELI